MNIAGSTAPRPLWILLVFKHVLCTVGKVSNKPVFPNNSHFHSKRLLKIIVDLESPQTTSIPVNENPL
jgi:hypothetical protein